MVIYLRHPIHGNKVATLWQEAQMDVINGWSIYEPDEPVVTPALEDVIPSSVIVSHETRRRGRPRKVV